MFKQFLFLEQFIVFPFADAQVLWHVKQYFFFLTVQFMVLYYVWFSSKLIYMHCGSSKSLALCVILCLDELVQPFRVFGDRVLDDVVHHLGFLG
jgi:hypothetical protein